MYHGCIVRCGFSRGFPLTALYRRPMGGRSVDVQPLLIIVSLTFPLRWLPTFQDVLSRLCLSLREKVDDICHTLQTIGYTHLVTQRNAMYQVGLASDLIICLIDLGSG